MSSQNQEEPVVIDLEEDTVEMTVQSNKVLILELERLNYSEYKHLNSNNADDAAVPNVVPIKRRRTRVSDKAVVVGKYSERKRRSSVVNTGEDRKSIVEEKRRKVEEDRMKKEQGKRNKEAEKELKKKMFEEEKKRKEFEKEEKKRKDAEKEEEKKRKEVEKEEKKKREEEEKKRKEVEKERREEKKRLDEEKRLSIKTEKEEEKRKKDEEKKRLEEKHQRKVQKQRQFFKSFTTDQKTNSNRDDLTKVGIFTSIELKKDMKFAPIDRTAQTEILQIDDLISSKSSTYFDELCRGYKIKLSPHTWPIQDPDVQIVSVTTSKLMETKTFLFTENVRPPYHGTWQKKSAIVSPLNPLAQDTAIFDYEINSDDEWECESGEDIGASEGEEEEDITEEPDDDDFLVPHGYLSEGEDYSDVDHEDEPIAVRNPPMTAEAKHEMLEIRHKQFQADRKQKIISINPEVIGPFYEDDTSSNKKKLRDILNSYRMVSQLPDGFPINCNLPSDLDQYNGNSVKSKSVPNEAIPYLIRFIHCNTLSKAKLAYEFRMFWEKHISSRIPDVSFEDDLQGKDWDEFSIGKKRLFDKMKTIAERKDGKWVVKNEVIQEYQLCCIDDNPENPCCEPWVYISNVQTIGSTAKILKKLKAVENQ